MTLQIWNEIDFKIAWSGNQLAPYGCAINLLTTVPNYRNAPFSAVAKYIGLALRFGHIKFFFDSNGNLTGLMIWGWLAEEVQTRLVAQAQEIPDLHPSEWKEGRRLQVLTLVALSGSLRETLALARVQMSEFAKVAYWVSRRGRLMWTRLRGGSIRDNAKLAFQDLAKLS